MQLSRIILYKKYCEGKMRNRIILSLFLIFFSIIFLITNDTVCFAQNAPTIPVKFFTDVPPNHWAYEALLKLYQLGLITGYPDGTYKGNQPMTRYEIALIVYKMLIYLQSQIDENKNYVQKSNDNSTNSENSSQSFDQMVNDILSKVNISKEELQLIKDLVNEFRNELISFEQQYKSLEARVKALEDDNTSNILSIVSIVISTISILIALFL